MFLLEIILFSVTLGKCEGCIKLRDNIVPSCGDSCDGWWEKLYIIINNQISTQEMSQGSGNICEWLAAWSPSIVMIHRESLKSYGWVTSTRCNAPTGWNSYALSSSCDWNFKGETQTHYANIVVSRMIYPIDQMIKLGHLCAASAVKLKFGGNRSSLCCVLGKFFKEQYKIFHCGDVPFFFIFNCWGHTHGVGLHACFKECIQIIHFHYVIHPTLWIEQQ